MRIVCTIILLILLVSCSMEGVTKPSETPPVVRDYYLPYVANVDVPSTVSMWDTPEIVIRLAANNPEGILNGIGDDYIGGAGNIEIIGSNVWIYPWIYNIPRTGEVAEELTVTISRLEPGEYTVHIQTANSLENSAVHAIVQGNNFSPPEPTGTSYLTYQLTVLPAD